MKASKLRLFIRPYRYRLILLACLALASSAVLLIVPWIGGELLGGLLGGARGTAALVAFLVLALTGYSGLSILTYLVSAATSARLLADLRLRVFDHIIHLPLSFHDQHRKSDTLAIATTEITRLSRFLTGPLVSFPARLLTAVGAAFLLLRIDLILALIVPVAVPLFYLALKVVGRRLRALGVAIQKADAEVLGRVEETLDMLPMIKIFTREHLEHENYRKTVDQAAELQLREARIYAVLEPVISLVAGLFLIFLLYAVGQRLAGGGMRSSELFSFLFYTALLTRPMGALAQIYGEIQTARGTLLRLEKMLTRPVEASGEAINPPPPRGAGSIEFEHVSFQYPGREPVLNDLNLRIEGGQRVVLVGANGAGKTTLIHLLCAFYQPRQGTIRLDGANIATMSLGHIRRQIALVPQRAMLLNASIRENILYGSPNATEHELEHALQLAQAEEFIAALPEGLETRIGDRGIRLSGGQRQRIALARAVLKDPSVLILDEATSMFDATAEQCFLAALKEAFKGRTVIMISHRPGCLLQADRIIEVAKGRTSEIELATAALPD